MSVARSTVQLMETFEAVIEPADPRVVAMLLDAFTTEGVTVVQAPTPREERRDAVGVAALALGSAAFALQAADSDSVRRAIASVNERLNGRLKSRVSPRHKK